MPIMDERRIKFDLGAIREILKLSQFAALSAAAATFKFVGTEITLGSEKLGALLVAYCIRSGIKIPRKGDRRVLVEPTMIILAFIQDHVITPIPQSATPDQARPCVVGSNASVELSLYRQR
jgi:hypothetical protein